MTIVVQSLALGGEGPDIMVKDTIDVAGYQTRAGSRALDQVEPAQSHAAVVRRLLDAGWHINGKTNLHELAFGTTGINNWTGTPENPNYPGRVPGGSSSGSAAAVAAGLCRAALGTDTGGSIRTPAACCGVFGLKPSFGRVSREGVMPAQTSLDCVGPFARDMGTLVNVMRVLCSDFGELPAVENARIGVVNVAPEGVNPEVLATLENAISCVDMGIKSVDLRTMEVAYDAGMTVINRESWNANRDCVDTGLVAEDVAQRLLAASQTTDEELQQAEAVRQAFSAEVDTVLQDCEVLALPTMPDYPAQLSEAGDTCALLGMTRFVRPFNLSGHPAITIPLVSAAGLPVGLQLVAARGADELLCAVASAIASRISTRTEDE
ncbi:amidase [Marinobacterium sp. YM272]|uniref:amidase n=1 Tax=Marinobacterium sp. YM272 TaxID=3421654 RepID=UPI003D7F5B37